MINLDFYTQLGLLASAMMKSDCYCQYPVACISVWLEPAVLVEQVHFFRDVNGNLAGYMTWAYLAEDAEYRLIHEPNVVLHLSEWNEGDRLWILDLVVINGDLKTYLKEAMTLFPEKAVAWSLRRNDDGYVRRVTTWRHR